ncbi:hypothetical protein ACFL5D_02190 [Candidatus Neomarinimicrobiota bacterium]
MKLTDAKFNELRRDKQISESIAMLRSIVRKPLIHSEIEERNRIDREKNNVSSSIKDLRQIVKNEYLLDHLELEKSSVEQLLSGLEYYKKDILNTDRIRVGKYTERNRWIKQFLMRLMILNEGAIYETVYSEKVSDSNNVVQLKTKKVLTKKFKGIISRIEREDFVFRLIVKYNLQRYRFLGKSEKQEKVLIKEKYQDKEESIRRIIRAFDNDIRKF